MGVPGRKSYFEELNIAQRYADLTPKAFKVLSEMLDSKDKVDQKWAVEQLQKGLVKMIPQDITSGGQALQLTFDSAFNQSNAKTTRSTKQGSV